MEINEVLDTIGLSSRFFSAACSTSLVVQASASSLPRRTRVCGSEISL